MKYIPKDTNPDSQSNTDTDSADRFATAAFAMGKKGIEFIENLLGFEGYMIDSAGVATKTKQLDRYTA